MSVQPFACDAIRFHFARLWLSRTTRTGWTGPRSRTGTPFVNGTGVTGYGDGLGLEVGDSFWLWSDTGAFSLRHAPPWEAGAPPAPEAGRIAELVAAGWLDALHSFGDWNPGYQLNSDDIARGFDILDTLPARPQVYVNHGGGGLRRHNIGGSWSSYQSGDDPDSAAYNLAGLLERQFRYFWTDVLFENERFGENLMLDRLPPGARKYRFRRWESVGIRKSRDDPATPYDVLEGLGEDERSLITSFMSNNLLVPMIGRDDQPFLGFKRFRGQEAPNTATFALQVSAANLDQLEQGQGACVAYQHFGVWRALGRGKGHASQIEGACPALDDNAGVGVQGYCGTAGRWAPVRDHDGSAPQVSLDARRARLLRYVPAGRDGDCDQ